MTLILERPCAPWCTPDDMPCDVGGDCEDTARALLACDIASAFLYRATGRRISGECTDVVRPGGGGCAVQWLAYAGGGSRPIIEHSVEGGAHDCSARHGALELVGPIVSIDAVWLDGVELDASEFYVIDRRYLLRASGSWPCWQRLEVGDHAEGAFTVEYTFGISPDVDAVAAAALLACQIMLELAPATQGESCLPPDLQAAAREGVTFGDVTFTNTESTKFGIGFVDRWVHSVNPGDLASETMFVNPRRHPLNRRS